MENKNPTAPAPDSVFAPPKADPDWHWEVTPVISLRDYFAVHATDGDIEETRKKSSSWAHSKLTPDTSRSDARYAFADDMLATRKATEQPEQPETAPTGCLSPQSSPEHAPEAVSGQQEADDV